MVQMKTVFLFFVFALAFISASAQTENNNIPAYQRFPTVPPIQILLSDSITIYTKKDLPSHKPVLLIVFNPECEHCRHETEDLIAHKKQLKNVQIVMITLDPLYKMKDFISKYGLKHYANMVVGKDIHYILPGFYDIQNIPYLAMYNKKGNLIQTHEGTMPMKKVIEAFNKNK